MAERVEEWPGRAPGGGSPRYPWDEWLDGTIWRIAADEYAPCSGKSFRSQVGTAASKRGLSSRTSIAVEGGQEVAYVQALTRLPNGERVPLQEALVEEG